MVGSIYFCVDIGLSSFERFQTKGTVATIENDHYYWNATLPSLTVCPMDRINMDKFNDYCEWVLYIISIYIFIFLFICFSWNRYRDIKGQDKDEFYLFIESMANATYINFENIREFESIKVSDVIPLYIKTQCLSYIPQ